MSFQIRDPIFSHTGEPGIVKEYRKNQEELVIDSKSEQVQKQLRHGYIKGMAPNMRVEFDQFMDKVKATQDPKSKVNMLQERIKSLEKESTPNSQILIGYLRSELAHVMHLNQYYPRHYEIHLGSIP